MILLKDLKSGMGLYSYDRNGILKYCDVISFGGSPTKFGYIHEDDNKTLKMLLVSDLEYFFKSKEEAEQFDLFQ